MAESTKNAGTAQTSPAQQSKGKAGTKKTRAERGLPELTPSQKMTKSIVQQVQNACQLLKQKADHGEPLPKDVLDACGVIIGSMSSVLSQ